MSSNAPTSPSDVLTYGRPSPASYALIRTFGWIPLTYGLMVLLDTALQASQPIVLADPNFLWEVRILLLGRAILGLSLVAAATLLLLRVRFSRALLMAWSIANVLWEVGQWGWFVKQLIDAHAPLAEAFRWECIMFPLVSGLVPSTLVWLLAHSARVREELDGAAHDDPLITAKAIAMLGAVWGGALTIAHGLEVLALLQYYAGGGAPPRLVGRQAYLSTPTMVLTTSVAIASLPLAVYLLVASALSLRQHRTAQCTIVRWSIAWLALVGLGIMGWANTYGLRPRALWEMTPCIAPQISNTLLSVLLNVALPILVLVQAKRRQPPSDAVF